MENYQHISKLERTLICEVNQRNQSQPHENEVVGYGWKNFAGISRCNDMIKVAHADTQLYTVAHKLHEVERSLDDASLEDMDDLCVMELLESMTEVKKIEENLRKDIQEVQQLQRDVTTSIRVSLRSMQQTFFMLKKRIEVKAAEAAAASARN